MFPFGYWRVLRADVEELMPSRAKKIASLALLLLDSRVG